MVSGNSFPLVKSVHSNPLRRRERSFESCLVVAPEANSHHGAGQRYAPAFTTL